MRRRRFYLPPPWPERGNSDECRYCGIKPGNQHTLREAAKCDRIRWRLAHPQPAEGTHDSDRHP